MTGDNVRRFRTSFNKLIASDSLTQNNEQMHMTPSHQQWDHIVTPTHQQKLHDLNQKRRLKKIATTGDKISRVQLQQQSRRATLANIKRIQKLFPKTWLAFHFETGALTNQLW